MHNATDVAGIFSHRDLKTIYGVTSLCCVASKET